MWLGLALAAMGCERCGQAAGPPVGSFDGGVVTAEELQREAARLPPVLRVRFETPAGRQDLVSALIDRKLLALEARRRKLDRDLEVRRQVDDLEEKLTIQALLAEEEQRAGAPTEAELKAAYEANRSELTQAPLSRVRRILVEVSPGSARNEVDRARQRVERLAARLKAREAAEKVAAEGDGPEKSRGGDLGFIAGGSGQDPALVKAVAALAEPGAWSPVVTVREGFALFQLIERRPARTPSFEEARAELANRLAPQRKRKAFDELLARLRTQAKVKIAPPASGPGEPTGGKG
jgi:parvulin-like peptidyl-prolyl isomerase